MSVPVPGDERGERLQKVLAAAGVASRRRVEDMVRAGRITVNGAPARLGQRIDSDKDVVEVDGSRVPLRADLVHLLVNKPVGVVSTAHDPEGRPTVLDLVDRAERLWPVGRLDVDSEGALIVTNDGALAHRITHPRYGVTKTYVVAVGGSFGDRAARALRAGVELDDGVARAERAAVVERTGGTTLVEVVLTEGRNHEVRRMFDALGFSVLRLVRTAIGPLRLGRLTPGSYRKLGPAEVSRLYRAAGL